MAQSDFIQPGVDSLSPHPTLVGQGATSLCYKVNRHGKWYIRKSLRPELTTNPLYIAAFNKEIELGLRLDHPNIVRYIDSRADENGLYILTDYIDGLSLDIFLTRHPGYFKRRANREQFVKELFSAIQYLHSHQMLHLDLKPENILITRQGHHVKLIDLGFAYQDCYPYHPAGSARYAAPEQISNAEKLSPACDIYAIGRILQYIGISKKKIINRCIAPEAKDRYLSVEELQKEYYKRWGKWCVPTGICILCILAGYATHGLLNKNNQEHLYIETFPPGYHSIPNDVKHKVDSSFTAIQQQLADDPAYLLTNGKDTIKVSLKEYECIWREATEKE